MQEYYIESSKVTPSVYFNLERGILDVRGFSTSAKPLAFYNQVNDFLDLFKNSQYEELTANFAFKHLNSSSSKCLYLLFKKMDITVKKGKNVSVNWYYQDSDEKCFTFGNHFKELFGIEVNMISVKSEDSVNVGKPKSTEYSVA